MATAVEDREALTELKKIHYIFTIAGLYYTQQPKGENVHNYKIDVPINHVQLSDEKESPISIFKKVYAEKMMPLKYPGYQGLYTYEIVDVKCTDPSRLLENTKIMNGIQLRKYIRSHGLPVKPDLYEDVGSLRNAIAEFHKDAEGFLKVQGITEKRKGPTIKQQNEADKMLALYGEGFATGTLEPRTSFDDDLAGI